MLLLKFWWYFKWGVSHSFSEELLLNSCCWFKYWTVSLTLLVLVQFNQQFFHIATMISGTNYCYSVFAIITYKQIQMLSFIQTKMKEQGLSGYSSAPLTSSARPRLGKCQLSWEWHASGYFRLSACLGHSSHRHASSGFVSVQTRLTAQSWHDVVRTSVFLFTLLESCRFSEEFLLHSSSWF